MTIGARISRLIKELKIKKNVFADTINVSQAFVSQLCAGIKQPSNRTIADICREFNVNEHWLRTGDGEMFKPKTRNESLTEFFSDVLSDSDSIKSQLVSVLAAFSDEQWELLGDIARKLSDGLDMQKNKPGD